jgi:hypothetical protein
MTAIPFCGPTYTDKTLLANAQDSINLYPMRTKELEGSDKKISQSMAEKIIMYPTPGYKFQKNLTSNAIRGFYVVNTTLYIVAGNTLYSFTPSGGSTDLTTGTYNNLGTLNTSSGIVSIQSNTVQLAISDGSYGYTYTYSGGAFAVTAGGGWPATGGVTNLAYYDGYIFALKNGGRTVIQSNVLDATTYASLAFDTLTSFSDNGTAIFSDELQLYVFGPRLTEVQVDAGTFPYAGLKVPGVLIQAGCVAWQTIQKVSNTIIWLASDKDGKAFVATLQGYQIKVISTPPINEAFERYTTINDAFGYSYREGDSHFYCLTFPTAAVTWVYDVKMDMWHKRSIGTGADLPQCCTLWQGVHVVGDDSGNLYLMSQDYPYYSTNTNGTITDTPLRRVRATQHIMADGMTLYLDELWIDLQVGDGYITDSLLSPQPPSTPPLATLEISRDRGRTWVNVGAKSIGATGEYKKRLIWRKLGRFRISATFRLSITDAVQTYIIGADAKFRRGKK